MSICSLAGNYKFPLRLPPMLRVEANSLGICDLFFEHIRPLGPSIDTFGSEILLVNAEISPFYSTSMIESSRVDGDTGLF